MKIWHTTVSAAVFTALLICGMAWPYDESKRVSQIELQGYLNNPMESQEHFMKMAQNPEDYDPAFNQEEPVAKMDEFKKTATDQGVKKLPGFHHIYLLDMTVPSQSCPSTLKLHTTDSLRLCGKTKIGCDSITIPTNGESYQEVRGIVRAYQFGSPDAFHVSGQGNIDSTYVDGVSITHGKSPRKHIWTFAIAYRQYPGNDKFADTCPSTGGGRSQPAFVGDDYFCSSGNPGNPGQDQGGGTWSLVVYPTPLWSNIRGYCSDCGDDDLFFYKKLPSPTNDDLEVRVCANENLTQNEDIRIEYIDLYIR